MQSLSMPGENERETAAQSAASLRRHQRRNEIHALRLGVGLLAEQIRERKLQDALKVCEALAASVEALSQLEEPEPTAPA